MPFCSGIWVALGRVLGSWFPAQHRNPKRALFLYVIKGLRQGNWSMTMEEGIRVIPSTP